MGSVRATLNDAGVPQAVAGYDAWGVPETPLIGSFGFTGELQRGNDGWLRARWYGAARGSYGARDAWAGEATRPYSLMPYQYAYAVPTMWTDARGQCPAPPASMGKHVICMALFIAPAEVSVKYTNIILHGDNREFSNNSQPSDSRGYIWINTDTGIYQAHMNKTGYILWFPGGAAIPPGLPVCDRYGNPVEGPVYRSTLTRSDVIWAGPSNFNKWDVRKINDTIVVQYDLVLGGLLEQAAPHINGKITFYRDYIDLSTYQFAAYGERDGFPWAEAYMQVLFKPSFSVQLYAVILRISMRLKVRIHMVG